MNIDLSRFKVVYGERVVRAVSLIDMRYPDGILRPCDSTKVSIKPSVISVIVVNSDGNLEIISDEAWRFQFIPEITQ